MMQTISLRPDVKLPPRVRIIEIPSFEEDSNWIVSLKNLLDSLKTVSNREYHLSLLSSLIRVAPQLDPGYQILGNVLDIVSKKNKTPKARSYALFTKLLIPLGYFCETTVIDSTSGRKLSCLMWNREVEKLAPAVLGKEYVGRKASTSLATVTESRQNMVSSVDLSRDAQRVIALKDQPISLLSILMAVCPKDKMPLRQGTLKIFPQNSVSSLAKAGPLFSADFRVTTFTDSDSIMTIDDTVVVFAIMSLVFHAHVARFYEYSTTNTLPRNYTHINIDSILSLISTAKVFGGDQRNKVRESLERIFKTNILVKPDQLVDLSMVIPPRDGIDLRKAKVDFNIRPIQNLTKVSFVGEESTMDYLIELPDVVFVDLFTNKFHWLLPRDILTIDRELFELYLFCRNLMGSHQTSLELSLQDLFFLSADSNISCTQDDQKRYLGRLRKVLKNYSNRQDHHSHLSVSRPEGKRGVFELSLFGYECKLNFNKQQSFSVNLNEEVFREALSLDKGSRSTPTVSNPFSDLSFIDLLQQRVLDKGLADAVDRKVKQSQELTSNSGRLLAKAILSDNSIAGTVKFTLASNGYNYYWTVLSTEEQLAKMYEEIVYHTGFSLDDVTKYVEKRLEGVKPLESIDAELLPAIFDSYCLHFNKSDEVNESTAVEFINMVERQDPKIQALMMLVEASK